MSSDFGQHVNNRNVSDGLKYEIDTHSRRFRFYKVRVNGVMQLVKEPKEEFRQDLVTLESLKKEFSIGYGLNHDGLPRYYSFDGVRLYQEFVEGETLRDFIERSKDRPADREYITTVLIQLLEVVCYLHEHGVVHLDIKPENVMITSIGSSRIKLIDLGASKSSSHSDTPGFTAGHMAPEQLEGDVNFYTDLYQVGLIAAELAPLTKGGKTLKGFIRKSTAETPSDRFGSAREALAFLMNSRARGKRKLWIGVGLIVMVALGAGIGYGLQTGPGAPKGREVVPEPQTLTEERPEEEPVTAEQADTPPTAPAVSPQASPSAPAVSPPAPPIVRPEEPSAEENAPLQTDDEILTREIDAYVSAVYEKYLSPFYSDGIWGEDRKIIPEKYAALQEASETANEECMNYCRELSETTGKEYWEMEYMFIESMKRAIVPYNKRILDPKN